MLNSSQHILEALQGQNPSQSLLQILMIDFRGYHNLKTATKIKDSENKLKKKTQPAPPIPKKITTHKKSPKTNQQKPQIKTKPEKM